MNRLTEYRKDLKRYEYKRDEKGYCFIQEGQIVNKLGQLEDLEEELGCPLEVVFKLAKQGRFYYEQDKELHLIVVFDIELRNNTIYFNEQWLDYDIELGDFGTIELPLSQYGKTFWLKKDKSE
jgi:hypothetical protein